MIDTIRHGLARFWVVTALTAALAIAPSRARPAVAEAMASARPEILDRVIAVVNGDVLLESDVQDEIRFAILQPYSISLGQNTAERAAGRLINRSLMLQQMKEQQSIVEPTGQEVQQRVEELKKILPSCAQYHCQTETGWKKFLDDHDLSEAEVRQRTRMQLQVLKFIEVRFRAGIRVSQPEVQEFYRTTLLPQYDKNKLSPPPVASVSARVEEILLQQKVNILLQDWLKSLRTQGNVQILDPAYAQVSSADGETGGEE